MKNKPIRFENLQVFHIGLNLSKLHTMTYENIAHTHTKGSSTNEAYS